MTKIEIGQVFKMDERMWIVDRFCPEIPAYACISDDDEGDVTYIVLVST